MMPSSEIASANNKLYSCRNSNLLRTVPQPHHSPSNLMQKILPEDLFLGMLCLERKRAERSGKKFLLLLLDAADAAETRRQAELLKGVINAANAARRETDPAGWYKHNSILGIIFTELGTFGDAATIDKLLEKIHEALLAQLSGEDVQLVHVSAHIFSDDSNDKDSNNLANPTFYPDLVHEQRAKRVPLLLKRVMDIIGGVTALVLFSPLLVVIALVVKLTSKGPILFKQERLGQFRKTFTFLKFRSMHVNNDPEIHQEFMRRLISGAYDGNAEDGSEPVYKMKDDPRITCVGRFLRRTSLDELPQFINVLRGDMSLVGPRPPLAYEYQEYDVWHRRRVLEIKPGITGLWQVKGRSRVRFDDMVRLDLQYVRGWSLWLDIQILLKTPGAVVLGDGAY
jgi:lipopolysaccharide/colanic/teichoic acid biosynthesis glycosyltransferase